jgi:hypothetical protein
MQLLPITFELRLPAILYNLSICLSIRVSGFCWNKDMKYHKNMKALKFQECKRPSPVRCIARFAWASASEFNSLRMNKNVIYIWQNCYRKQKWCSQTSVFKIIRVASIQTLYPLITMLAWLWLATACYVLISLLSKTKTKTILTAHRLVSDRYQKNIKNI